MISAFILFIICACSSTSNKIPKWVESPQDDNIESIYGVGVGLTFDTAKQSALENIASKFSIQVESNTNNRQTLHNGRSDVLFQQNINTKVKAVQLTQYKLLKTESLNNLYYVLISISRAEFVSDKKNKLQLLTDDIALELKNVTSKNKVEQLYRYNKVLLLIEKAEPLIHLLRVADARFIDKVYIDKFNQYIESERKLLASTRFFVYSTNNLYSIATSIKDSLETQGFQLAPNRDADGFIDITGSIKNTTNFSTKNTRIDFNVLVKSATGQVYKKSTYRTNGVSISSYKLAEEIAITKFADQINNKLDIYKMFGFH